jgi:hypothetical protein
MLGLFRGLVLVRGDPGTVLPDAGHLEQEGLRPPRRQAFWKVFSWSRGEQEATTTRLSPLARSRG